MLDRTPWRHAGGLIAVFIACSLLPACSKSKLTAENYEKIQNNMSLAEVEALLGKGSKDESGDGSGVAAQFGVDVGVANQSRNKNLDTYVWESGRKSIKVYFNSGKVASKSKDGF